MPKILVVDDAAFMRMMIKDTLTKLGYIDIIEGSDGVTAVEMYKLHNPDLTMLDITMPNLDGIGALKEIKAINPDAKCVMCSAMGQEKMVMEAITLGALDFIVKPFKSDRVAKTMKSVFG